MRPAVRIVARSADLDPNAAQVHTTLQEAGVPIFILPDYRHEPTDFQSWARLMPFQLGAHKAALSARDGWGGERVAGFGPETGDIIDRQTWSGSSFANTEFHVQLRQNRIIHVIPIGLIAKTCMQTIRRHASERGYHVTLVRACGALRPPGCFSLRFPGHLTQSAQAVRRPVPYPNQRYLHRLAPPAKG
ncbi:isochorismatase family protein [Yoonia vestfoldensis]|uniref:isochorismatase family protein n=1 Tax=Yoonia vestfoldensis TaxID=245188 RepID=UPI000377CD77|nr:isochorismatase family protein [Yoonia vestfoldensis]